MSRHPLFMIVMLAWMMVGMNPVSKATDSPRSLPTFTLPSDPITFQPGPGKEIASGFCLICHSAEYIYMQPPHSAEHWRAIIRKMQQAFGCPIPEEQIAPLATYLVSQNAIQPQPPSQSTPAHTPRKPEEATVSVAGDAKRGKQVYQEYCVNCHGTSGKGDGPIGQVLVPPAANLTATGKKSDKELLNTIQHGRKGTAMPGWQHDLSSSDILNVLWYIRRLSQ